MLSQTMQDQEITIFLKLPCYFYYYSFECFFLFLSKRLTIDTQTDIDSSMQVVLFCRFAGKVERLKVLHAIIDTNFLL